MESSLCKSANCNCDTCIGFNGTNLCECVCHGMDYLSDERLIQISLQYGNINYVDIAHSSRNHIFETIAQCSNAECILQKALKEVADKAMRSIAKLKKKPNPALHRRKKSITPIKISDKEKTYKRKGM